MKIIHQKNPTPKLLKRNILFEIIKLSVKNGGHFDFDFLLTELQLSAWENFFSSSPYPN